jgi:hypothetical protein
MRHATALLYHVCAVASRNIRFASCGMSGKLTLWTRYVELSIFEIPEIISVSENERIATTPVCESAVIHFQNCYLIYSLWQ